MTAKIGPTERQSAGAAVVYTGVERSGDGLGGSNNPAALPISPAALRPPKEPEAAACPLTSDDMVAELPKAPEPAEAPKLEKLIYPKIVQRIGWR